MGRFKRGQEVWVRVGDFAPWPAVVQNAIRNETQQVVFYSTRLFGSEKEVPLEASQLVVRKAGSTLALLRKRYSGTELAKAAKDREDLLFGTDDDFPDILWDLVTVESDYEEVPEEETRHLKLSRVVSSAIEVHSKFEISQNQNVQKNAPQELSSCLSDEPQEECDIIIEEEGTLSLPQSPSIVLLSSDEDNDIDVEGLTEKCQTKGLAAKKRNSIYFPCETCPKRFRTRIALKKHNEHKHGQSEHAKSGQALIKEIRKERLKRIVEDSKRRIESAVKGKRSHDSPIKTDLDRKVEELLLQDQFGVKENAQKLHTCMSCFRKFTSKELLKEHRLSHEPLQGNTKDLLDVATETLISMAVTKNSQALKSLLKSKNNEPDEDEVVVVDEESEEEEEDGDRLSEEGGDRLLKHCSMERERRAALASRFAQLGSVLGLGNRASKIYILNAAKQKIEELNDEGKTLFNQLTLERDLHKRLHARMLQLTH